MKAMIFAAGLGTRLRPYTESMPKAMVPVAGRPMLERLIEKLKLSGFTEVIINVHHFATQVTEFLKQNHNFGIRIEVSDESGELLETGGGLKKASWFFDDGAPFLLHNVDILSDLDLKELMQYHKKENPLVTLAVSERKSSRFFLFDEHLYLRGWEDSRNDFRILTTADAAGLKPYAFSGIHVLDPRIFKLMTEKGKFSLVDLYLRLAASHTLKGMVHPCEKWVDMGRIDDLRKAEKLLSAHDQPDFR